jgi:RNA polymerase sigma factor (sigma-70 family)
MNTITDTLSTNSRRPAARRREKGPTRASRKAGRSPLAHARIPRGVNMSCAPVALNAAVDVASSVEVDETVQSPAPVVAESAVVENAAGTVKEPYNPLALLKHYENVVRQIVGGFQRKLPRNVLRDDLMAAGMSGLWDAVRKHGHEASENFDWYVRVRIRGAILDELRAQDWLPRRARAAAAEANQAANVTVRGTPVVVRFDEVSEAEQARCLTAGETSNTETIVEDSFTRARLATAMEQLPDRERRIVAMHYFRGVKFKDLGTMLGVSEPRISQLHSRAMSRLKVILAEAA